MNKEFWKGRRVLITGHTGFKGSWLSLWLQSLGAIVTGYSLPPPTNPNLFELAHTSDGMASLVGDIRDFESLKRTIADTRPEVLFHLAAQSIVRLSYENPAETYSTNVMGTVNVLEAARQLGSPCILVVVTSDKCYENKNWIWGYREDEPMGGRDPYSNSKACAELVARAYRESYFNQAQPGPPAILLATGRAGNVIGGGDWTKDQLLADVMRAFLRGKPVRIRNPDAVRPWQFVMEALRGYLVLAEHLSNGGPAFAGGWNFGPCDEDVRPVSWIVERLSELWGGDARWESDRDVHPHEDHILKLDISKARRELGWSPKVQLDTTLMWVVEWYKAYEERRDMRNFTETQIARYQSFL
jgi:CDP-glucose 4,6-dehydratase